MAADLAAEQRAATLLYARPGLTVFVGKRNRHNRTDVMAGSRGNWFRAISCIGDNHAERAAGYVEAYRAGNRALNQARRHAGVCAVPAAPWDCDAASL
jgi:hypothetical protein